MIAGSVLFKNGGDGASADARAYGIVILCSTFAEACVMKHRNHSLRIWGA